MAWRFNDPVTLTLSRSEAGGVYFAIKETLQTVGDSDGILKRVLDRMMKQIEHKPGTGPLRNKPND